MQRTTRRADVSLGRWLCYKLRCRKRGGHKSEQQKQREALDAAKQEQRKERRSSLKEGRKSQTSGIDYSGAHSEGGRFDPNALNPM